MEGGGCEWTEGGGGERREVGGTEWIEGGGYGPEFRLEFKSGARETTSPTKLKIALFTRHAPGCRHACTLTLCLFTESNRFNS